MRGDNEEHRRSYRRLPREPLENETDASFSDRGVFEELEDWARTPEMRRAWDRVRTAAIRGAASGILIKGGLHTLTFVMYLLSRVRGKGRQRVTTLADALRDTVLHTAFLAALGSSYTAVDEGIALIFGKTSTQRWRALVAGLVAGQALRITGSHQRHYSLATYILLRGLTLLVRTGNKPSAPPALRALLRPTRMQHGDTLLMCVATSQILYSFIMAPSTLPPTYVRFITRMGGKDPSVWAAIREHALRNSSGLAPGPLQSLVRTPLACLNNRHGRIRRTPCEFFHPGQSCSGHAMAVVPQAYATSLSVYVPFYLVSSVLVHRTALLAKPGELLPKMALAVLRSSAFLSVYIATAFAGACGGFFLSGTNTGAVIAGSVWAGGLATLLEKKSRRMELAMYCAARAMEAFIRCCWLWGVTCHSADSRGPPTGPLSTRGAPLYRGGPSLPPPVRVAAGLARRPPSGTPRGGGALRLDVLLFSLGCGAIMHCYSDACGQHRDVFRSKYLNVLDFIFGNEGVQQGSITHVPTNLQLVSTVGRRLRTMSIGMLSSSGDHSPLMRSGEPSRADSLATTTSTLGPRTGHQLSSTSAQDGSGGGLGSYSRTSYSGRPPLSPQGPPYQQLSQYQSMIQQQRSMQPSPSGWSTDGYSAGGGGGGGLDEGYSPVGSRTAVTSPVQQSVGAAFAAAAAAAGLGRMQGSEDGIMGGGGGDLSGSNSLAAPLYGSGGSNSDLPVSPVQGLLGEGREVLHEGVVSEAMQLALSPGGKRSGGGAGEVSSASSSNGEWEDVWAAATGTAPNAAAASTVAGALPPPLPMTAGDGAVPPSETVLSLSAGDIAVAGTAPGTAATASSAGALGWAARLVAGALSRNTSRAASSTRLSEAAAEAPASAEQTAAAAAAAASSTTMMRRIMTAPTNLASPQLQMLLSDPASEGCGRGRSSNHQLQRLNSLGKQHPVDVVLEGDEGLALAEGAAASAASAGGFSRDETMVTASMLAGAEAPPPPRPPAPASPYTTGFRAWPVSLPVPIVQQRMALDSDAAATTGDVDGSSAAGAWPRRVLGRSLQRYSLGNLVGSAGSSVGSGLDRLTGRTSRSGAGAAASAAASAFAGEEGEEQEGVMACEFLSGGGDVGSTGGTGPVTFAPRGALSHPSPVPGAAMWPRVSLEMVPPGRQVAVAEEEGEGGQVREAEVEEEGGGRMEVGAGEEGEKMGSDGEGSAGSDVR